MHSKLFKMKFRYMFLQCVFFLLAFLFINQTLSAQTQFNVGNKGSYLCSSDSYGIARLYKVSNSKLTEVSIVRTIKRWKVKRRLLRLEAQYLASHSVQGSRRNKTAISNLTAQINAAEDCAKLNNMTGACNAFQSDPETSGLITLPIIEGASCHGYKSQVAEIHMYDSRNFFLGSCTGTIVNKFTVITAAHCIRTGSSNTAMVEVHTTDGRIYSTTQVFSHPDYLNGVNPVHYNDIGVIRTTEEIDSTSMKILNNNDLSTGEIVTIAGYGVDQHNDSGVLNAGYSVVHNFNSEAVTIRYVPGSGSNSCYGDSGGPIAVYRGSEWVLAGVTSNGSNGTCGVNGKDDLSNWSNISSISNLNFIASIAPELFE